MNYLKLIIGISTLCLFGCSPSITEEYVIENQTKSNIIIYFDPTNYFTIESNNEVSVYKATGPNEGGNPFLADSVVIEKEDLSIIFYEDNYNEDKNIFNITDNWKCETIADKRYSTHYKYTYTITEDDFPSDDEKSINPAL